MDFRKVLAIFLLLIAVCSISFAEEPQVVANVGVVSIESVQTGSQLDVNFTILNAGNYQPQLKYGVKLIKPTIKGEFVAFEEVFDKIINLDANSKVLVSANISLSNLTDGFYQVWVSVRNPKGLELAVARAGDVQISGAKGMIEVMPSFCKIKIADENNTFSLIEGVAFTADEKLSLSCSSENGLGNISVHPKFSTYFRSIYGELVSAVDDTAQVIELSGAKPDFEINLPNPVKPQAYDVVAVLVDGTGKEVSNKIVAHYVLSGESGTVQNITADKKSYSTGENAILNVFWTPSADSYPNARKTTLFEGMTVEASLSSNGTSCSSNESKAMAKNKDWLVQLSVPINANCPNPVVTVKLLGKNGNVLDEMKAEIFNSTPGQEERFTKVTGLVYDPASEPQTGGMGNGGVLVLIGGVIVILIIIIAVVVIIKKRAKK